MPTPPTVRLAITRAGALVGLIAAAAYLFCIFATLTLRFGEQMLALGEGAVTYKWAIVPMPRTAANQPVERHGLSLRARYSGDWTWLPRSTPPTAGRGTVPFPGAITIPLWIPLLFGAISAYYLLPIGPPRGRCAKCNYNLRGVPKSEDGSTRCPECGTLCPADPGTRPC